MTNVHLDMVEKEAERNYNFKLSFEEITELFKTRQEDEDLAIEDGDFMIIPSWLINESVIYITEED